jgi:DNA invertase Pin-like site-specific DNA recombinase
MFLFRDAEVAIKLLHHPIAEFERSIIRERVLAGMKRAKEKGTKTGKAIGRPAIDSKTRTAIAQTYAKEKSLRVVAKQFGVGVETVRRCLSD